MSSTTLPRSRRRATPDQAHASDEQVADSVLHPDLRELIARMPLWRRPGYLVRRLHQIHSALFQEECAGFEVTPVQYALLTTLLDRPDCDQNSLAQEIGLDRTNAADVLCRLARQGLVTRRRSPRDNRMVIARLTPRGEALTTSMHEAMSRAQHRLIEALAPEERELFLGMLLRLVDANNSRGRTKLRPAKGAAPA